MRPVGVGPSPDRIPDIGGAGPGSGIFPDLWPGRPSESILSSVCRYTPSLNLLWISLRTERRRCLIQLSIPDLWPGWTLCAALFLGLVQTSIECDAWRVGSDLIYLSARWVTLLVWATDAHICGSNSEAVYTHRAGESRISPIEVLETYQCRAGTNRPKPSRGIETYTQALCRPHA